MDLLKILEVSSTNSSLKKKVGDNAIIINGNKIKLE